MSQYNTERDAAFYNRLSIGSLPGLMGIQIVEVSQGQLKARLEVRKDLHAPNGFLHAGTVVTLADTACGYGCSAHLSAGAKGFTTTRTSGTPRCDMRAPARPSRCSAAHK